MTRSAKIWLQLFMLLAFATVSTFACAQEDEEEPDEETLQTEKKDPDAAKRARKGERKSRKDKKSGKIQLSPPPRMLAEFEFFDGVIFTRKVDLGINGVLCFASARRPLALLWREGNLPPATVSLELAARELQLVFGRPVETAQVSVLNESGQMVSRGTASGVAVPLGRKPVYLLVETTPSRPGAAAGSAEEELFLYHENLNAVRVYPDPKRAKGARTIVFANLTREATIQILSGENVVFEISNPGAPAWKWDGTDRNRQPLPDGKYFYRILTKGGSATGMLDLRAR
ncbi:MAG: hypothetical protein ONB44_09000 [candidate division KSB1 bacterium]|nr:hypothetical protein [candidate division KSB1 bacterium]MDZ7302268.1 hypothetical protein [candidate division KSB1 bacterium]MDZ7311374.1 hypothetical protein [candidate division KSB1 bacterium]